MPAADAPLIRRIRPDEGPLLRDLRMRSVSDAPDAFGQTIGEVEARPELEWQRSARRAAQGARRSWFVAELDERGVGIVQGRRRPPRTLLLFSMWVDPSVRRLGIGRRLVEALEDWGRDWGATETVLWVLGRNIHARDFYLDLDFEIIREGVDAESGAQFAALAMRRRIAPGSHAAIRRRS